MHNLIITGGPIVLTTLLRWPIFSKYAVNTQWLYFWKIFFYPIYYRPTIYLIFFFFLKDSTKHTPSKYEIIQEVHLSFSCTTNFCVDLEPHNEHPAENGEKQVVQKGCYNRANSL